MDNNKSNITSKDQYIDSAHRLGRIGGAIAILVMISMPIIAGIYFDAVPTVTHVLAGSVGILVIMVPAAIAEVLAYTPIIGSSIYLTLVTGNVTNLKIPVVNNALKILDIQNGSEDADIISGIAVCASTFITVLLIALGVLLMVPLKPVLELSGVQTASKYIMPSLFGSMALGIFSDNIGGGVRAPGRMKGAIVPAVIIAALYLLDTYVLKTGLVSSFQGVLILLMLPVTYIGTKTLYSKGKIRVLLPNEPDENKK